MEPKFVRIAVEPREIVQEKEQTRGEDIWFQVWFLGVLPSVTVLVTVIMDVIFGLKHLKVVFQRGQRICLSCSPWG